MRAPLHCDTDTSSQPDAAGRLFRLEDKSGNCVLRMTRATCTLHNRTWLLQPSQGPAQRADAPVEIVLKTHALKGTALWHITLKGGEHGDEQALTLFGGLTGRARTPVRAVLLHGIYGKGNGGDTLYSSSKSEPQVLARFFGDKAAIAKETRERDYVKERDFTIEAAAGLDVALVVALALLWHKGVPANDIPKATGGGGSSSAGSTAGASAGACTCSTGACTC